MGVPRLYPWLRTNFRTTISHFAYGEKKIKVDFLFLDANAILHSSVSKVLRTQTYSLLPNIFENLTLFEKEEIVFATFFSQIVEITKTMVPTQMLYIALDGPAPIAKQNQQRARRMLSVAKENQFDKNSITPGTEFMYRLSQYLEKQIPKQIEKYEGWENLSVILSNSNIPGEGEHKIMDYIRSLPENVREGSTFCLMSPDADLIMLCLASHLPNVYLFREDNRTTYEEPIVYTFPNEVDLIDISSVAKTLPLVMNIQRNVFDCVNDFLCIGFFVGNDFLPKFGMFYLLEEGLNRMLSVYSSLYRKTNQGLTNVSICFEGLKNFISEVAQKEIPFLIDDLLSSKNMDPKFFNMTLMNNLIENVDITGQTKFNLDYDNYRKDYYAKFGITKESEISELCRNYLRVFVWVYEYYTQTLPSWKESYPYFYAPLMNDLSSFVSNLSEEDYSRLILFEKGNSLRPFEQLVAVLPKTSANLLPEFYAGLLTSDLSPLVQKGYLPSIDEIEFDCEGKRKDHECIPNIKLIPVDYLTKIFSKFETCGKQNGLSLQHERNQIETKTEVFTI